MRRLEYDVFGFEDGFGRCPGDQCRRVFTVVGVGQFRDDCAVQQYDKGESDALRSFFLTSENRMPVINATGRLSSLY